MIECLECGTMVRRLASSGHLRLHNMKAQQYLQAHPGARLTSPETAAKLKASLNEPEAAAQRANAISRGLAKPEAAAKMSARNRAVWQKPGAKERHADRMRERHKSPEFKAKIIAASHSPEASAKRSQALTGVIAGDKHPLWAGGITPATYWERGGYQFKAEVSPRIRERDGFKCTSCSLTEAESLAKGWGVLAVHHDDEDSGNNADENLKTVCKSCHTSEHNRRRCAA